VTNQVDSGEVIQVSVGLKIVQEFREKSANVVHVVSRCDVVYPEIICMSFHLTALEFIATQNLRVCSYRPINNTRNYQPINKISNSIKFFLHHVDVITSEISSGSQYIDI
jgi:hypothetical protein